MSKVIACFEAVSALASFLLLVIFLDWVINEPVIPEDYRVDDKGFRRLSHGVSLVV